MMGDEEALQEPDSDFEGSCTKRFFKIHSRPTQKTKYFHKTKEQHFAESELYGAESSDFVPAYPDRWAAGGGEDIDDMLLHSCCTAEGSIALASPGPMLEFLVHLDDQHSMEDCPNNRTVTPPASPAPRRLCPVIRVPSSVTASTVSSVVNPMVSSPMTDTCSPISSMCSPTGSAWDTLRSTLHSPCCSDHDPVSAAAHLHLLGESLSLIGHHLQETNKTVSVACSLSVLLDSLLCALAPLICLTTEIPELRSCLQNTVASALDNIAYVMPGL